jgi:hypothetical protein
MPLSKFWPRPYWTEGDYTARARLGMLEWIELKPDDLGSLHGLKVRWENHILTVNEDGFQWFDRGSCSYEPFVFWRESLR